MRRLLIPLSLLACLALLPAVSADAATLRCKKTHGTELAHSTVVKIYKVKAGPTSKKYRFFGCAKPNGVVTPLTESFTGSDVKMVAAKGAFAAFTRTISKQDTIAVVDARTGKKRHGLFPPGNIDFDIDPRTPQIGAARINAQGELVVAYVGLGDGSSTDSTTYIYAFDNGGGGYYDEGQLLDSGTSSKLKPSSIKLDGEDVTWTHDGAARSAKIGQVPLSILFDSASTGAGDVTAANGISCHLTSDSLAGNCVGSFDSGATVTITAHSATGSGTVTISGGCSASQTSTASCDVKVARASSVKVKFS
jgi:hypothetical protein